MTNGRSATLGMKVNILTIVTLSASSLFPILRKGFGWEKLSNLFMITQHARDEIQKFKSRSAWESHFRINDIRI